MEGGKWRRCRVVRIIGGVEVRLVAVMGVFVMAGLERVLVDSNVDRPMVLEFVEGWMLHRSVFRTRR